ncbi:Gfo/Idh/MocA family protein [Chloroflexota bacterium]
MSQYTAKILFIGLGSIGQRHLRNLRQICGDKVEILAYRSLGRDIRISENLTAESGVDLGRAYGVEIFTDYAKALEQNPCAVFITNPTGLHVETALEAAKHDCHLFIEKPLSDSLEGLEELVKLVKERNLTTLVGYQLRFHPSLKLVHRLIEECRIGQVLSVHSEFGEYLPDTHPYEDYRKGYAARSDLGGGALFSLSHELDYLYWLFGMPQRLFALGGKLSQLEMDADDTASILMECTVDGKSIPVHAHLDFVQRPPSRKCYIVGEEGKISCDYSSNRVDLYTAGKKQWESFQFTDFQRNDMFLAEIKHFIACLEGKEKPVTDINEGLKSLRIALAAKRSLESGTVVEDI